MRCYLPFAAFTGALHRLRDTRRAVQPFHQCCATGAGGGSPLDPLSPAHVVFQDFRQRVIGDVVVVRRMIRFTGNADHLLVFAVSTGTDRTASSNRSTGSSMPPVRFPPCQPFRAFLPGSTVTVNAVAESLYRKYRSSTRRRRVSPHRGSCNRQRCQSADRFKTCFLTTGVLLT